MIQIFRNLNKPIIYFSNGYIEKTFTAFTYFISYKDIVSERSFINGYIAINNLLEHTNNIIFFSFKIYYLYENILSLKFNGLYSELLNVMPLEFMLKTDSDFINFFSKIENYYENLIFI
jgi:hypothetical protein